MASGKGLGTAPDPGGPRPGVARIRTGPNADRQYTLSQLEGALSIVPLGGASLGSLTRRVYAANGWNAAARGHHYPPFRHVIYILRENRTYDQILGDLPRADGDTALVFFGRQVTPNAHALAERFGVFDRFFVNAEVSGDGHNWSMAAYATDYTQKTVPVNYSSHGGRSYDFEGTNRDSLPKDDVAAPAQGFIWNLAERAGVSFRDFGERVADEEEDGKKVYVGSGAYLAAHTDAAYPGFDLGIPGPAPRRHLAPAVRRVGGGRFDAGAADHPPSARPHRRRFRRRRHAARDGGRQRPGPGPHRRGGIRSHAFWKNTLIVVLEDDAQDGPDHVDSHRSPLLLISAWNRPGVVPPVHQHHRRHPYHRGRAGTGAPVAVRRLRPAHHRGVAGRRPT